MNMLSRRGFLAASAAAIGVAQMPRIAFAQALAPFSLTAAARTLDIDGRAATVFGLAGPNGQGLVLDPGQRFRVDLTNDLDVDTIIHWHGQIPPNAQDGVPDMPMPLLSPGETRS
jgi:Putative multicopper oxidases